MVVIYLCVKLSVFAVSKHNISPKLRLGDKISSTKVDREKANLENITIQTLYWKVSPHWS
jgi:hypothetical protein